MLTLRRQAEDCNDDILPAHGCHAGFADAAAEPVDDEARQREWDEAHAIQAELEAQRSMRVIREAINESKARLRAAAPHCRCEVNFVMSGSDYDNGDRFDVWLYGTGKDDTFFGFGEMTGRTVAEALSVAETEALLRASIADVAARKAAVL